MNLNLSCRIIELIAILVLQIKMIVIVPVKKHVAVRVQAWNFASSQRIWTWFQASRYDALRNFSQDPIAPRVFDTYSSSCYECWTKLWADDIQITQEPLFWLNSNKSTIIISPNVSMILLKLDTYGCIKHELTHILR